MADIASKVTWTLSSGSQGKLRLGSMQKYDIKSDAKTEAVNEVGGDFPVGFKDKPGALTISFEFHLQKGKPKPDWHKLHRDKELVTLTKQIDGGPRTQYIPCRVSSVDDNGDSEGEHMFAVEVIALEDKPL